MKVTVKGEARLEAAFDDAARDIVPEAKKVVSKGCQNIKRDWRARWQNLKGLQGLPRTIDYDVHVQGTAVRGEVGPNHARGGQAPLAWIPEYGAPHTAPRPGGSPALAAEGPRFTEAAGDLGERLLR